MRTAGSVAMIGAWLALGGACTLPVLAQSQSEMNRQAEQHFQAADARLSRVYRRLLNALDRTGQAKLRKSQRAWIAYRDAEADLESDRAARGGSMAPMIYAGTQARQSQARTRVLEQMLSESR